MLPVPSTSSVKFRFSERRYQDQNFRPIFNYLIKIIDNFENY